MDRSHWANVVRMPGLALSKDILGFLMTTESQDLALTSHSKDSFMGINPQMAYLWLSLYIKQRLETVFQNNSVKTQTSADNFTAVLPSPVVDGTPDQI